MDGFVACKQHNHVDLEVVGKRIVGVVVAAFAYAVADGSVASDVAAAFAGEVVLVGRTATASRPLFVA